MGAELVEKEVAKEKGKGSSSLGRRSRNQGVSSDDPKRAKLEVGTTTPQSGKDEENESSEEGSDGEGSLDEDYDDQDNESVTSKNSDGKSGNGVDKRTRNRLAAAKYRRK